jgi:hypothetical protein
LLAPSEPSRGTHTATHARGSEEKRTNAATAGTPVRGLRLCLYTHAHSRGVVTRWWRPVSEARSSNRSTAQQKTSRQAVPMLEDAFDKDGLGYSGGGVSPPDPKTRSTQPALRAPVVKTVSEDGAFGMDVFGLLEANMLTLIAGWPQCSRLPKGGTAAQHQAFCIADAVVRIGSATPPLPPSCPGRVLTTRIRKEKAGRRSNSARGASGRGKIPTGLLPPLHPPPSPGPSAHASSHAAEEAQSPTTTCVGPLVGALICMTGAWRGSECFTGRARDFHPSLRGAPLYVHRWAYTRLLPPLQGNHRPSPALLTLPVPHPQSAARCCLPARRAARSPQPLPGVSLTPLVPVGEYPCMREIRPQQRGAGELPTTAGTSLPYWW